MASNDAQIALASKEASVVKMIAEHQPASWVRFGGTLRSVLSFNNLWEKTLGLYLVKNDLAAKAAPVKMLTYARYETDVLIRLHQGMVENGVSTKLGDVSRSVPYTAANLVRARYSHPLFYNATAQIEHHMWHLWGLPPASAVSIIAKYITLGIITGTVMGCLWRYGYVIPQRKKIDLYYKTLHTEHPEYWPAVHLTQQKKQ